GRETELITRLLAAHDDQTRERVRSVAHSLRPAQHFDAIDVERRRRHADAAEVDVVDEKADRWIRRPLVLLALADTADLEEARPRSAAGPVQIRHCGEHVLEVLSA